MDFSFSEILIIVIVAFIVFGPEKLPDLARRTGRLIGRSKSIWQSITHDIENTLIDAHSPTSDKHPVNSHEK